MINPFFNLIVNLLINKLNSGKGACNFCIQFGLRRLIQVLELV